MAETEKFAFQDEISQLMILIIKFQKRFYLKKEELYFSF
jgi:hypothetical protein